MHYGNSAIKRGIPLAMGLLYASNQEYTLLDTLSKYSHDSDAHVAVNAIFAMGLLGSGTNNARLGQILRQLVLYYHKDPQCSLAVRIAQGLTQFAKGTVTLNPYRGNRRLLMPAALAGLLSVVIAFTEAKECKLFMPLCTSC